MPPRLTTGRASAIGGSLLCAGAGAGAGGMRLALTWRGHGHFVAARGVPGRADAVGVRCARVRLVDVPAGQRPHSLVERRDALPAEV